MSSASSTALRKNARIRGLRGHPREMPFSKSQKQPPRSDVRRKYWPIWVDRVAILRPRARGGILQKKRLFRTDRGLISFMKNPINAAISIALVATGAFAFSASTANANEWMCNTQAQIMMTDAERGSTNQCGPRPTTNGDQGGEVVSSSGYATAVRLYGQNGSAVFWINSDRAAAEAWLLTRTN